MCQLTMSWLGQQHFEALEARIAAVGEENERVCERERWWTRGMRAKDALMLKSEVEKTRMLAVMCFRTVVN